MEVENKMSGLGGRTNESRSEKETKGWSEGKLRSSEMVLRAVALVLTLAAAVLLGIDKQTKKVSFQLIPTLPPLDVPVTAKWRYLSAFVYFVVANAIACGYAAVSMIVMVGKRKGKRGLAMTMIVTDLFMVALMFSSNGATGAIGLMGYEGNNRLHWGKVCDVFGKFCDQVAAALGLSFFGGIAFFFLVVMGASNLVNNKGV